MRKKIPEKFAGTDFLHYLCTVKIDKRDAPQGISGTIDTHERYIAG